MARNFEKILDLFADESRTISTQLIRTLSELEPAELELFKQAWPKLSAKRRLDIAKSLVFVAEEYPNYHFADIFKILMDDEDPQIRALALEGLWEEVDVKLVPKFMQRFQEEENIDVRAKLASLLGHAIRLSELEDIPDRYTKDVVTLLWDAFHHPREHLEVRRRALEGLSESSHPGVQRLIENAFYHDSPLMRSSALFAMGRTYDHRWIPFLLKGLEDDAPALRMESARALGTMDATKSLNQLISMLDNEKDQEVRLAILEALGQIGGEKAQKALEMTLESDNEAEASAAEDALEYIYGGISNITALINEVLGIESDEDAELPDAWIDFMDDPLEAELRELLDNEDFDF